MFYLDSLFQNYLSGVPVHLLDKLNALSTINKHILIFEQC